MTTHPLPVRWSTPAPIPHHVAAALVSGHQAHARELRRLVLRLSALSTPACIVDARQCARRMHEVRHVLAGHGHADAAARLAGESADVELDLAEAEWRLGAPRRDPAALDAALPRRAA